MRNALVRTYTAYTDYAPEQFERRVFYADHRHRTNMKFQAYCVCGRKMVDTTPQDVWHGIQPFCPKCEPTPPSNI